MKCKKCSKNAVFSQPKYCKKHFMSYVESNIAKTIKKFNLISRRDKIVVAVSGGKDSLSVLYNLRQYNPVALAIDEGISGYREKTLADLDNFCKKYDIKLKIVSIKKEFGFTLDSALKKTKLKPCTVCGAIRRYLINKYAKKMKATKLATGHNMDDEAQSILMNLFRNQLEISARLGPMTGLIKDKRFIQRIKPLYFLTEKEITAYSFIKNFGVHYIECPYSTDSYRNYIADALNNEEQKNPGTKANIVKWFLKELPALKKQFATDKIPNSCEMCGEPAHGDICKVCELLEKIKKY